MNTEAFKLARATLRLAVKEYGWSRRGRASCRPYYAAPLGKFEGEHWAIVHYYDAMLNGGGDEPLYSGEECVADLFEVSDTERAAFGFHADTSFVALWHSSNGFEHLAQLTATEYDDLRAQYEEESEESDNVVKCTAPSHWASYFINGDDSGLEPEEKKQADAWLQHIGMGYPVSCEDAGFIHSHDARAVGALPADCQEYTFLDERKWFSTSSGRIELRLTLDDARSGSQPGKDAEEDIADLRKVPYIAAQLDKLDPATLRGELKEYGAWNDAELADHDRNLTRILWLACGDIREQS